MKEAVVSIIENVLFKHGYQSTIEKEKESTFVHTTIKTEDADKLSAEIQNEIQEKGYNSKLPQFLRHSAIFNNNMQRILWKISE